MTELKKVTMRLIPETEDYIKTITDRKEVIEWIKYRVIKKDTNSIIPIIDEQTKFWMKRFNITEDDLK